MSKAEYAGEYRNKFLSSIFGASMIFSGLKILLGSNKSFACLKILLTFLSNIFSMNSDLTIPSPCSPEKEPPNFLTKAQASSAIILIFLTSSLIFIFKTGRTCKHPTEA